MAQPAATQNELVVINSNNPTSIVKGMIDKLNASSGIHLPKNYSFENALKSAWLVFEQNPSLKKCSQPSIVQSLFDMIVQGMNVAKKQGYFIAYGETCQFQRSYFGDEAIAKRIRPGIELYSAIIYDGDDCQVEIARGKKVIAKHTTSLDNQNKAIKGAYAGFVDENGVDLGAVVMTMAEIQKSWGQSKTYKPGDSNCTHNKFPVEMSLRTVVRKLCKPIINSSSDELLLESVRRQDSIEAEVEIDAAYDLEANGQTLELGHSNPPENEGNGAENQGDEGKELPF